MQEHKTTSSLVTLGETIENPYLQTMWQLANNTSDDEQQQVDQLQLERKNEEMGQCEYTPMEETKREQMGKEHATPPPLYTIDETSVQA